MADINVHLNTFLYKNNKYVSFILDYKNYSKLFYTTVLAESQTESVLIGLEYALNKINDTNHNLTITTNSNYVNKAIKYKWYNSWYENGWTTKDGSTVKDWGLWLKLRDQLIKFNSVQAVIYDKFPIELKFCNYQVTGVWR